ncbi:hypothetical protein M9458_012034, partial [Cirrhinus mrigala]
MTFSLLFLKEVKELRLTRDLLSFAVDMEITWFGQMCCICTYKNREMAQGVGYEGRASLFIHDLKRGNVSLRVADFRESDLGVYMCRVTSNNETQQITVNVAEE